MATVRIYKVASLLGLSSQEAMSLLKKETGIEVKSASGSVEEIVARQFVEKQAKARKIGVWQGPAEAPWDFRHGEWRVAETAAPKNCSIKGNISSHGHIYHLPWSPWYDRVSIDEARGERWFCSEADALAAGWRPASSN